MLIDSNLNLSLQKSEDPFLLFSPPLSSYCLSSQRPWGFLIFLMAGFRVWVIFIAAEEWDGLCVTLKKTGKNRAQ